MANILPMLQTTGEEKGYGSMIRLQVNKKSFSGLNPNSNRLQIIPILLLHGTRAGKYLPIITDEKADLVMYFYRINEKTTEKRNLLYFDKVLDFSYSPEGSRLVFSAVKDGITDIYIHTIASGTNEQITRDIADDLNPSFLKNSPERIIFSSNRLIRYSYKYR